MANSAVSTIATKLGETISGQIHREKKVWKNQQLFLNAVLEDDNNNDNKRSDTSKRISILLMFQLLTVTW